MAYTKLFSTIVTSTIWTEDANTCKVWVTMLAIANKHGEVQASIPGLAQICGLALDDVEKAVAKFLSPDKYSRTKDAEGRRIEEIDGGWSLINHAKYRRLASKEEAQEANAERQRRFKSRTNNTKVTADNAKVTADNGEVTADNGEVTAERDIAEAEVLRSASDAERREAKTTVPPNPSVVPPSLPPEDEESVVPPLKKRIEDSEEFQEARLKLGECYRRKPTTKWDADEIKMLKSLMRNEDFQEELATIHAAYIAPKPATAEGDFRRKDLQTLLNNWTKELDRARNGGFFGGAAKPRRGTIAANHQEEIVYVPGIREPNCK